MGEGDFSRDRPSHRFAGMEHRLDLGEAIAQLRSEARTSPDGHRQVALLREGPFSLVLLSFDPGAEIKEHHAEGLVSMQILGGSVRVRTPFSFHELGTGQILLLKAGVPHSISASTASEMLLSIYLHKE
jgi:quercetin dioxygenase-like cupin family protein